MIAGGTIGSCRLRSIATCAGQRRGGGVGMGDGYPLLVFPALFEEKAELAWRGRPAGRSARTQPRAADGMNTPK